MSNKRKNTRDIGQSLIYKIIQPLVTFFIRLGITPNIVTTIGFVLNIVVAIIFIFGAEETSRGNLSYIGWAGALILFAGLFDMIDGQVARIGKMASRYGAFYDSVMDRYSELIMFLGICYYLIAHHYFLSSLFAFIAMIGSMMVSYIRARAEGLGIECKDGLMQRPERIIIIGVSALTCGIVSHFIGGNYKLYIQGIPFHVFETISIFTIPIVIVAILANYTAYTRLMHSKKSLKEQDEIAKTKTDFFSAKTIIIFLLCSGGLFSFTILNNKTLFQNDTYPIPKINPNTIFYVQKTNNTNTIVYESNINEDGKINTVNPVKIYWIRFAEKGQIAELSYIQRHFAYGIESRLINPSKQIYQLNFVSYKKRYIYLMQQITDNKYHAYIYINGKLSLLKKIFIKTDGGTFWFPKVKYVEVTGNEISCGNPISEKITP